LRKEGGGVAPGHVPLGTLYKLLDSSRKEGGLGKPFLDVGYTPILLPRSGGYCVFSEEGGERKAGDCMKRGEWGAKKQSGGKRGKGGFATGWRRGGRACDVSSHTGRQPLRKGGEGGGSKRKKAPVVERGSVRPSLQGKGGGPPRVPTIKGKASPRQDKTVASRIGGGRGGTSLS